MSAILTLLAAIIASGACAYHRTSLRTWAIATAVTILLVGLVSGATVTIVILLVLLAAVAAPLLMVAFRRKNISAPLLKIFANVTPKLSETEQTALEAGTVGFEGELFSGKPRLVGAAEAAQARTQRRGAGLPRRPRGRTLRHDRRLADHPRAGRPAAERLGVHQEEQFFGMIIPKTYGGLGFSALAHSAVLQKLSSMSQTLASTVAVPNSLGPAELLLHYGSDEQKNHYLPRLADGREIPCFALTGPYAGSDATSIPDYGIVSKGLWHGEETRRHAADLRQALHHAGAGRDRGRPGLPHVRPGQTAGRDRGSRHHAGPAAARNPGDGDRPPPLPAEYPVPERPDPRARTCSSRCPC